MSYRAQNRSHSTSHSDAERSRLRWVFFILSLSVIGLVVRLFQIQVLDHQSYRVLASDQHVVQAALVPRRGTIYVRDRADSKILYPIAQDRDAWQVYAVPKHVPEPQKVATRLAGLLSRPEGDLLRILSSPTSSYAVLDKDVPLTIIETLRQEGLPGIAWNKGLKRYYPERNMGGHVLGFVSQAEQERVGRYGIEGKFQTLLAGERGALEAEKDAAGRRISIGRSILKEAKNGADIVLTLDRTIQYRACEMINSAVERYQAEAGTVVIIQPETGAILGMCSSPDYNAAEYGKISHLGVLNNPATFYQFEPGSIFKPITMAAGLDAKKITPQTTYNDTGAEAIDGFTIRNSDKRAHGIQTMSQVLESSLNTGTIFVQRLLGSEAFREYVEKFGFGQRTGIEQPSESSGDIQPLWRQGEIFGATASFGQGITVTPLQMVAAYAALANGGTLVRPRLVEEIIYPDGRHEVFLPETIRRVVSERASRLVSAMLTNVVERGHGKQAAVPGYYVAGKTGTAQIPNPQGQGYLKDATIGSFAGYAPAEHPAFVMLVKIDRPKIGEFAESTAAPVFGELASFLLTYLEVQPERPLPPKRFQVKPSASSSATSTESGR